MSIQYREKIALFAGSFDPFTVAHERVVIEALAIFDSVVVGVGENISKNHLLSIDQRVRLIGDTFRSQPRVRVAHYSGLTTTFAREIGATAVVRGVRGAADLEVEQRYNAVNSELAPEITTVLLMTPNTMTHISSSCVRELLHFGERECAARMLPEGIVLEEYL